MSAVRKFNVETGMPTLDEALNDTVLALLAAVPGSRGDPDLGATNEAVTIIWLN